MEDDKGFPKKRLLDSTSGTDVTRSKGNRSNAQSSFEYPYGIPPPTYSYLGPSSRPHAFSGARPTRIVPAQGEGANKAKHPGTTQRFQKRQDLTDSIMDWYSTSRSGTHELPQQSEVDSSRGSSDGDLGDEDYPDSDENVGVHRRNSVQSNLSLDSDSENFSDGRSHQGGPRSDEDSEKEVMRRMDYKTRRKHIQRIRIQFNVSCTCL
jgi:hypothetical protein